MAKRQKDDDSDDGEGLSPWLIVLLVILGLIAIGICAYGFYYFYDYTPRESFVIIGKYD